jgi:hypothetical protein
MFLVMSKIQDAILGSGALRRPGQRLMVIWQNRRFKRLTRSLSGFARAAALIF